MIKRRPLAPNNRKASSLTKNFRESEAFSVKYPKSNEQPSIRIWARRGRPTGEGFGGGSKVGH